MVDPASIRNASFSLTPTGYNPEEVDRFLGDLADDLRGADPGDIRNASFSLTPTGYNPEEVDEYLAAVADALADESGSSAVAEEAPAVPFAEQEQVESDHDEQPEQTGDEPAAELDEVEFEVEAEQVEVDAEAEFEAEAEAEVVEPEQPVVSTWPVEDAPVATLPEPQFAERSAGDLDGLAAAVEHAIGALQGLLDGE